MYLILKKAISAAEVLGESVKPQREKTLPHLIVIRFLLMGWPDEQLHHDSIIKLFAYSKIVLLRKKTVERNSKKKNTDSANYNNFSFVLGFQFYMQVIQFNNRSVKHIVQQSCYLIVDPEMTTNL